MELYNEEMKGEILVTRRATYKAEEAVSGLEKDKGRQDLFIDRLMEQARKTTTVLIVKSEVVSGGIAIHPVPPSWYDHQVVPPAEDSRSSTLSTTDAALK